MEIYAYTLVTDSGFAPAVKDGLLSLACCKTRLRYKIWNQFKSGKTNIFLIGLSGVQLQKKITKDISAKDVTYYPFYIARITDAVSTKEYFDGNSIYASRPDCQYMLKDDTWWYKNNNPHNPQKGKATVAEKDNIDIFYTARKGREHQPYDYNAVLLSEDYCLFGFNQEEPLSPWFKEKICQVRKKAWRSDRSPLEGIDEETFNHFFEKMKEKGFNSVMNRVSGDTVDDYFLKVDCKVTC